MSYRVSQPSPLTSTGTQLRIAIQTPWSVPVDLSDTTFLRSWLVYDSQMDDVGPRGRINWNVALGMLLVLSISAGFWTGVGLLIAKLLK
jgi:hypothetical protein